MAIPRTGTCRYLAQAIEAKADASLAAIEGMPPADGRDIPITCATPS